VLRNLSKDSWTIAPILESKNEGKENDLSSQQRKCIKSGSKFLRVFNLKISPETNPA